MSNNIFKGLELSVEEAERTEWYAIWSVGIPKEGNPHNWFVYHAQEGGDLLSSSYVLHEYIELKHLEAVGCSPFDLRSLALARIAKRDGFTDVRRYLQYLNGIHTIVVNQKVAQASLEQEYIEAHEAAFIEQLRFIREHAFEKGYDVTLGALAMTIPFARDRGEMVEEMVEEADDENTLIYPSEEELKVAKQYWNRLNDDLSYNAFNRSYAKKFSQTVKPAIGNICDFLLR